MKIPFFFSFLFSFLVANAQSTIHVRGVIMNEQKDSLAFASIYVQGTSLGTTSNLDGYYDLELPTNEKSYTIIYQYVGYQQTAEIIEIGKENIEKDIVLKSIALDIQEVVVSSSEDPALRIIRNAIRKRPFYLHQLEEYRCQAYMKGVQRISKVPKSIMGQSMEELRKGLDSTGSGIVYMSESVSELAFRQKEIKETMISSKVSGNDNGFSFNSGAEMQGYSFYENTIELGDAQLLSPIGTGALSAYKYELVSTFLDGSRLVHQLKVTPKNSMGQLFQGYIYIVEGEWNIHSADLFTTGKVANISMLDTISFRQLYVPLQDSVWRLFSQDIDFQFSLLGIEIKGHFVAIFRNYDINPHLNKKQFTAEVFKVETLANKKTSTYWDSIRPVPLTIEETLEYQTKDSLQKIWKTKPYMDSVDRKRNKFTMMKLLTTYTYMNSYKRLIFNVVSPLANLQFNTVQGWNSSIQTTLRKGFDEDWTSWYEFGGSVQYGLADKQWRGKGHFKYKFNDINEAKLTIEGGREVTQFNEKQPVGLSTNSLYSIYGKINYLKLYDKYFSRITYEQRFGAGIFGKMSLEYAHREALTNHSDHAWNKKTKHLYFSNNPLDFNQPPLDDTASFAPNNAFQLDIYARFRIGEKFISYPKRRFYSESKFPDLWIHYRKAIPLQTGDSDYDYLAATIQKDKMSLGRFGILDYSLRGGIFLRTKQLYFMDYKHFSGNRTIFAKSDAYLQTFQLLPYYQYSTSQWFAEAHIQYNCNGFLWNKMPLLKKLGFEWVFTYHYLKNPQVRNYMEFMVGIDRIGWGIFRILRVDFVSGWYPDSQKWQFGGVVGLKFSL